MNYDLTIAINGYKSPDLLRLCLETIFRELAQASFSYEVIVTDSATEEDTEMLMREEYSHVRFFPHRDNVGFKAMFNQSIREANGKYVFLINSDILITREAIEKLLGFAKSLPGGYLLGPKQLNFNNTLQQTCFRFYRPLTILYRRTWLGKTSFGKRHLAWFTMSDFDHNTRRGVDWVIGSAMFVDKKTALEVGFMDERFFMYMEDVDWCRRFWEKGYPVIFVPEAVIHHYHAQGSARGGIWGIFFNKLMWWHIASAIKYFLKYAGKSLPKTTWTPQ